MQANEDRATALGRAAGRTFAGFVPDAPMLRRRAEVAVCGQYFATYPDPITVEMVCERDAFVVAFLRICRPTPKIVSRGVDCVATKAKASRAKASHKDAS